MRITPPDGGNTNMATRKATKKSSKKSSTKSSAKKTYATKSGKRSTTPPSKRWSAKVKTDSTKPGPGLFKKSAKAIAEGLAKKSVSPKGPGQAMQMLSFYENRGGKNLSPSRKRTLENAKDILREKEGKGSKKSSAKKSSTKKSTKKAR
jgi:tRNA(adenine34) deaminase